MKKFVLIVISASLIAACNIGDLDFDNVEMQPITGVFSFPLGETTYVMRDLLLSQTDSIGFIEDTTSLITLQYFDTIVYNAPNDFIQINDIVQSGVLTAPTSMAGAPRTVDLFESFDLAYNPATGEQIDSLFYETGDLTIETISQLSGTLSYSYTIVNTTNINTNNPVVLAGSINGPGTDTQTQTLVNHKTKLTGGSSNTFSVIFDASVDLAATDNLVGNEQVTFNITYGNQTFNLIYGKFGQDTVQVGNQSIDIDFFSQANRDGITFGNPKMTFDFRNSFGVPVQLDLSGINGDDGSGGDRFDLKGDIVNNPETIAGSDVNTPGPNQEGETVQTLIEVNRNNSNILGLFASAPSRLNFDVSGLSNASDPSQLNYLQPTSQITAYVGMEIPMEIQLENLEETGYYGLGDGLDLGNVDSAFLRVVTINELPFAAVVNLEIQDADSATLYTVADNQVMVAPFINVNGEVTDPNGVTADIPLSPEGVAALEAGSHILITLILNTPASQTSREIYVKVLADYQLTVKVGVGGKLNLDL
ncbi:hypothetical protein [Ekhidna sp.]|uniref:hypothetical protein n=1 Tax=Ekhidna sp. TaxID=2608089 RepID=UPI003CCC2BA9